MREDGYQMQGQRLRVPSGHKKARTDNDHVQIWKVRNLLFVLIKHIGELAANFCTPCHENQEPFVENIYADLHNISDELKINVVDLIYIRHNQLENKYPISPRNPVPP
jgi:hypothetical protein